MSETPCPGAASPYDAAALVSAALAAALAAAIEPGPYDLFSTMIGATILLVIFAFERKSSRDWLQSSALGAVFGFVSLLFLGIALEAIAGGGSLGGVCPIQPCRPNEFVSSVPDWWLLIAWLGVSFIVTLLDIWVL